MERSKKNIIFIATNIPTPKGKSNDIILRIAEKLSNKFSVNVIFPKPMVPFGFHILKKHKRYYKIRKWVWNNIQISPLSFLRIPIKGIAFTGLRLFRRKINNYIHSSSPHLIHAHFVAPDGMIAYNYYRDFGIPYIVTLRSSGIKLINGIQEKTFDYNYVRDVITHAREVHCLNHYQQDFLYEKFGRKGLVIPHGINDDMISPPGDRQCGFVNIITVAEIIKRKNIDWIIKACESYSGKEKIILKVVGDGPELINLKGNVVKPELFEFMGRLDRKDVLDLMQESDIFALPSINETFGLVYLEAAAKGNALVGIEKEGVWHLFDDNSEMLYASGYDDFAQKLHRMIDNMLLVKELKQKANQKVKEFTWTKIISKYEEMYERALGKGNPALSAESL